VDLLLDSHIFLWWEDGSQRLGKTAVATISDSKNRIYVSAATVWEIEIKRALGKLAVRGDLTDSISVSGFIALPITAQHAVLAARLPRYHQDPFDRMLIAQAQAEKLVLMTRDPQIEPYGIPLFSVR
jgi:PIN domain nuclease of toxin-antitoxin system